MGLHPVAFHFLGKMELTCGCPQVAFLAVL